MILMKTQSKLVCHLKTFGNKQKTEKSVLKLLIPHIIHLQLTSESIHLDPLTSLKRDPEDQTRNTELLELTDLNLTTTSLLYLQLDPTLVC